MLSAQLTRMKAAEERLEHDNDVFCAVSGKLLDTLELGRLVGKVYDAGCEQVPGVISSLVDADRKTAATEKLIARLDEASSRLASHTSAMLRLPIVAHTARAAAAGVDPLSALTTRRQGALAALDGVSRALSAGQLDQAARSAREAAERLASLPALRAEARSYLTHNGLAKIAFSRARIAAALARLEPRRLPPRMLAWAHKLRLTTAQMRALVTRAKAAPPADVLAMQATSLACDPVLDEIDRSLAGAFREVAAQV